jgi:hypothetical protein
MYKSCAHRQMKVKEVRPVRRQIGGGLELTSGRGSVMAMSWNLSRHDGEGGLSIQLSSHILVYFVCSVRADSH